MTNIRDLHPVDSEAAARLLASVPAPTGEYSRKRMLKALPDALEVALGLLLEEVDLDQPSSSAVACRIIAAAIARLKD